MSNRFIARAAAAALFLSPFVAAGAAPYPAELSPGTNEKLVLVAYANGVQVYECAVDPATGGYQWRFKAPEAELSDASGRVIGKHYAGPTWESNDGSKVVGEVRAQAAAPDASAIPLLLLAAKQASGAGVLSSVRTVQRLETVGGRAPSQPCSAYNQAAAARVPYKATYQFYAQEAY